MTTPVYKSGVTVKVTVDRPIDSDAQPLLVTAVHVTVRDEAGEVVSTAPATVPADQAATYDVTVSPADNSLAASARKGARSVEVMFTTGQGVYTETTHYVIEASVQLVVLTNSFLTYPEALMVATDIPTLDGWAGANDRMRAGALMIAWSNLCSLRYRYPVGLAGQSRISDFGDTTSDAYGRVFASLSDIRNTLAWEWAEFPEVFKTALKRAQLVEADILLKGNPVADKRRSGIVSETIGESSMFFRQVPEVRLPVSREALDHLKGFVVYSNSIARA